jgi:hypothetical protein
MRESRSYNFSGLIGIPIILCLFLVGQYIIHYQPELENEDYDKIIYSSKRYGKSSTPNWHSINFKYFTIETPNDYHYYLEQGIHGGKVGGLTNEKDTILFVFGNYYFDACEGIVIGQIIGTCDTLGVYSKSRKETIFVRTDNSYCAFIKRDEDDNILKMWTSLSFDKKLIEQIYKSITAR